MKYAYYLYRFCEGKTRSSLVILPSRDRFAIPAGTLAKALAVGALIFVVACSSPPNINQVREQNQQLIGTPQGVKTLSAASVAQCDRTIQTQYLSRYSQPFTWQRAIAPTAMDTTNLYIRNASAMISQRVGYDVSRSVAFMTRYRGENFTGIAQATDFVCLYEVMLGNQMGLKAVYAANQFETLWGVKAVSPAQWGGE